MSLSVIAQVASAVTNILFVVVIAVGYFILIRLYRQMVTVYDRMLGLMEAQSTSMGRPLVVVYEDPDKLPNINLVVQNVGLGPAKDVSFEFSAPIESSDGFVLSELPVFREGMTSLAPSSKITCYWDNLDDLLPRLKEKMGSEHIEVTTRYKDLAGSSYRTTWDVQPGVFEGVRNVDYKGMNELVVAVERISENKIGDANVRADARGVRDQGR